MRSLLHQDISLPILSSSVVSIVSTISSALGSASRKNSGSGTLMNNEFIFTCRHIFELNPTEWVSCIQVFFKASDLLDDRNSAPAQLMILPPSVRECFDLSRNTTNELNEWHKDELDFAVLRLHHPIDGLQSYLKMPEPSASPNPLYGLGKPMCILGIPGTAPSRIRGIFSEGLERLIRRKLIDSTTIMELLMNTCLYDF